MPFARLKPAYWTGVLLAMLTTWQSCKIKDYASDSRPVDHQLWDKLTQQHVSAEGWVDYRGFIADSSRLNAYLDLLRQNHPNDRYWSKDERLAYWINLYNAFTVKLIVDHYPIPSIKDIKNGIPFINTVWDLKFIQIEGRTYDLNNIEHGIIRPKFSEPRIHFAVNCASVSCPRLRNEAYTADKLDQQLDDQTKRFLADTSKNQLFEDRLVLSKIFNWYGSDFTSGSNTVLGFIRKYTDQPIAQNPKIAYLPYNWALNDQPTAD